jgi:hypothetical protein
MRNNIITRNSSDNSREYMHKAAITRTTAIVDSVIPTRVKVSDIIFDDSHRRFDDHSIFRLSSRELSCELSRVA